MVGLGVLYSLFVGSFVVIFHNARLLASFWMLLLNRMLSALLGPTPKEGDLNFIVIGWATTVVCYLGYAFLTAFADIPPFGVTAAIVVAESIPGGLWAEEPWRVIAFGTSYYATIGVIELFGVGMARDGSQDTASRYDAASRFRASSE